MSQHTFILAAGFPEKEVLAATVVVVLWVVGHALSKLGDTESAKPTKIVPIARRPKPSLPVRESAASRQSLSKPAPGTRAPAAALKAKRAKQRVADGVTGGLEVPPVAPRIVQAAKPSAAHPVAAVPDRRPPTESARNARLLLQRNGVREAFLVSEILGRPKSME